MRLKLSITILSLFAVGFSLAQGVIPTKGKEFWVGFMENIDSGSPEMNLFIVSDQATSGVVEIPGQGYSQAFTVTANQTTTVSVPVNDTEHYTSEVIEQKGIYIETQDTVAVFAINFGNYSADGTKILPVPSLGTEYRISSYFGLNGARRSQLLIVATEDDSEVEITPIVATEGGNPAGVPFTVQLNRGESYQVKSASTTQDMMGTVVKGTEANGSCRPFAVFSGGEGTNIPQGCTASDHICDQNFPVSTWGTDFYLVPFGFTDSYTYRIMANEDNTNILLNGAVEGVLNAGEFFEYNDVSTANCVSADKGISVTQYMEGIACAGEGDPAMLILNDESQKIDNITFSTVDSNVINEHGLNLVMNTADVGTLFLDGVLVPAAEFTPFANCGSHSYANVTITEGSHTLEAANGVTAYVYGAGGAESYAYSVGSFTPLPPIIYDDVLCTSDTVYIGVEGNLSDIIWYAESDPDVIIETGPQLVLVPPIVSDIYVAVGNQFISGCTDEQYFSVEVPDPPVLVTSQSAEEVCQFQAVQLGVEVFPNSGSYTYTWSPAAGLDDPTSPTPIATPFETTTYTVLVSTATGCGSAEASLTIDVIDGDLASFEALSDLNGICSGEQIQLEIDIQEVLLEDNFDPAIDPTVWTNISNGTEGDACGFANGNALYFNGVGERSAETLDMDLTAGGSINFAIVIGTGAFPCDNVDVGEDIVLEYSTDGGGVWTTIQTMFESNYPTLTDLSIPIPADAQTAATRFKWRQLANSGQDEDNWSLDNVYIGTVAEALDFEWSPNYNLTATDILDPIATPLVDTTYYVMFTDAMTGCSYTDSVEVEVSQGFTLEMTPDTGICDLQGIQLQALPDIEGTYDYQWTGDFLNNPFIGDPIASPTTTTTYTVEVLNEFGCPGNGEVTINVSQLFDLSVATSDNGFCEGETVSLTSSVAGVDAGLTYEWSPSVGLDDPDLQNPMATPLEDVLYVVTVTDTLSGCILTDEIDLDVFDAFTVDAGEDLELCVVGGYQLEALDDTDDGLIWSWTPAALLDDAGVSNPTILNDITQEFIVTATSAAGCSSADTVDVTLLFESFDLGPAIELCVGDEVTIETGYGPEINHEWSTTETSTGITIDDGGIYSVTVTSDEGCVDSDDIEIIMYDLPIIDLGEDPGLCVGDVYELDAGNPGEDFEWSDSSTLQTLEVNETGDYSVVVTDAFQCSSEALISLIFHENPVINLPETHTMCEDEFLTLDAENSGSTYDWSTDETSQTVVVNEEGLYTVLVTNENNCTTSDQMFLTIETYPVVDLGEDVSYCESEVHTLDAGNTGLNFNWSTDETSQSIEISETDVYTVVVDNGYCYTTDAISVIFNPLPIDVLGPDTTLCFQQPPYQLLVNAGNNGSTYVWNTGATDQTYGAPGPGLYTVEVTTPFNCTNTFDIELSELCGGTIYLPNSFTPNNDGVNDVFKAVGTYIVDFEMEIWNRWGQRVFYTADIEDFWTGNHENGGHYVQNEVYTWVVRYTYLLDLEGNLSNTEEVIGHVTILR